MCTAQCVAPLQGLNVSCSIVGEKGNTNGVNLNRDLLFDILCQEGTFLFFFLITALEWRVNVELKHTMSACVESV